MSRAFGFLLGNGGGSSGNAFGVIQGTAGSNPTALAASATLSMTSTDGTVSITGSMASNTLDYSVNFAIPTGSVGAPGLWFQGDTNTGIYQPSADTFAITTGGVERVRFDSFTNGQVLIGNTSTGGMTKATLTQGSGIAITNGAASITIATNLALSDLPITGALTNYALLFNGSSAVWAPQGTSFTFSIASFTSNAGSTTVLIGSGSNWKAIGAISFSATYNNGPATSGSVALSGWSSALTMTGTGFVGPTASTEVVPYPASVGGTKSFTLTASNGVTTPTANITFSFVNLRFWGVSSSAGPYSESEIEALSNELSNSGSKTFTVTANTGEYILWASRTALGARTFTVNGFTGGFEPVQSPALSITNVAGFTEDYNVYRSTNSGLGLTTVVVT